MAIKQVEDLVEAWARGHRIVCNSHGCRNVEAELELRRGRKGNSSKLRLFHDGNDCPLAFVPANWKNSFWVLNSGGGWSDWHMLQAITIVKE